MGAADTGAGQYPPFTMHDLIYLGITAAFFIGSALYVRFCGNL